MILDCITMFVDPQFIGSQEDFQNEILNWSILLPFLSLHTSRAGKMGQELAAVHGMTVLQILENSQEWSENSEAAVWGCYIKNICSENFGKFS